jgi:hypothetical protein
MRFLNAALVVLTALFVAGGYLQDRKRLGTIRAVPPERARLLFETTERRRERTMALVTAVLVLAATAALVIRAVQR